MILTGKEIESQYKLGRISISDFDPERLSPNSYDLTLGQSLLCYSDGVLDATKVNKAKLLEIPKKGYQMECGEFLVGTSQEQIGSNYFVPLLHGKSGIARIGLFPHITADLLQLGFYGCVTFQLYAVLPVIIYPSMPIAQVSFWVPKGNIELYEGTNQGCKDPKVSTPMKG